MGEGAQCKYCGQDIGTEVAQYYIEPSNGFKSGETKESTRLKPKRSYAGEVTYVGGGKIDWKRLVLGNAIGVEPGSDDVLLVMNKSGFYMCPVGGSDIDGVVEFNSDMQSYDILLYDNVPGGAGHVKRLHSKDAVVSSLKAGLDKVSKECCDENTSCYNCLRNYYNQSYIQRMTWIKLF